MRGEIERRLDLIALDLYGLSEVLGPGVAQERADARGALTVWEDAFLAGDRRSVTRRTVARR